MNNQNPHKILVTGGAGFIGSHTVSLLLQEGKEVTVIDNLFTGELKRLDLSHPNLEFIEGDILDFDLIQDLTNASDAVLHLAAIASVEFATKEPLYTTQVNVQGFLHLLQAVYKSNRHIRLVYASSAAVYGDQVELPLQESAQLGIPLSLYSLHKIHCEKYAALYHRLYQIDCLGLRYFNVYGPGQNPQSAYTGVISKFAHQMMQDATLCIYGDGKQSRDYIHVSDVARANLLALESHEHDILNIGTGKPENLLGLIQQLEQVTQHKATIEFAPARTGDIYASYANCELAAVHLNFKSMISLQDGLKTLF